MTVTPNDHAQAAGFLEAIARPRLAPYFENLGHRPPAEMPDLYARCVGVVQPSLLESLSFGYLEAMAHGRPTVASDFDFSRGTLADAALYAGAHDAGGFLDALMALYAEGRIKPHISVSLPLDRAGEGIEMLDTRKVLGKVVVMLD